MSVIGKLVVSIVGNIKGLEQALDTAEGRIKAVAGKLEEKIDTKAFLTAGAAITGVGVALGGILVHTGLVAARVEVLETVLNTIGETAGYSAGYLKEQENSIKELGITTKSAREMLILFIQSQLDVADASKIARVAQDLAVISGQNSSDAAVTLTNAIASQNPMLLRQYGIVKNLDEIMTDYGKELGIVTEKTDKSGKVSKSWSRDLTEVEKKQAMTNVIFKEGEKVAGIYEEAMGDVGKQLTSLPRYIEEAKMAFGEAFIPIIGLAVQKLTELLKMFLDLPPETKEIITKVTMLAAGIALVVGPILTLIGLLPTLAAGFAILTGPVGIVIAILTGLIAVGVLIYKNWDKIKAKAIEIWEAIKVFFINLWEGIKTTFKSALQSIWQWMLDWIPFLNIIVENWDKIAAFFVKIWEDIKTTFMTRLNLIKDIISTVFYFIKDNVIMPIWNGVVSFFSTIWNSIITTINKFKGRFLRVWDYIKEGLKRPINAMIGLINSFLSKIESGINSMIGRLGKIIPGIAKLKISIPKIPKLALGGIIKEPGFVDVGERGRERIFLPKAAQVIPLEQTTSSISNYFEIAKLIVREEADIYKVADQLHELQLITQRGGGNK